MAIRDIFKFNKKTFVDPGGWLDLQTLKDQNRNLWSVLKSTFSTAVPVQEETFEEAMKRLNLTEADVQEMTKNYKFYAALYVVCALLVIVYTVYLLIYHWTFTGLLLGVAAAALFLSQAFRVDFWAFQMKSRRLGATFEEWKRQYIGGKGS